jgi:uncharacterized phage protein gp47/JayE
VNLDFVVRHSIATLKHSSLALILCHKNDIYMTAREDISRFSIPVEKFIQTLISEYYPTLNTAPGSAFYDLFITPAALLQQQQRDRTKVIQRNQSLKNYAVMLDEELDRLAGNFFVERKTGVRATGVQRVYYRTAQAATINTNAVFSDAAGNTFKPINAVTATSAQLANNLNSATGEYYLDVACSADAIGEASKSEAGEVSSFSGISGATRTTNLKAYFGGKNVESNSELYSRIKSSLTNKDLVKADAIKTAIMEEFNSVEDVLVQGYGDPMMDRDRVTVTLAINELFPRSFAQKVNLPLDSSGNVLWQDAEGNTIIAPVGGFVGAIYDLTDKDFNALSVTLDGRNYEQLSAQPGNYVRFLSELDADFAANDYSIRRVEEVPVQSGGDPVKVLRLDRPLKDTTDVGSNIDQTPYTILGPTNTSLFHVGGKIDIYVNSTNVMEKTVEIGVLPPVAAGSDVSEVPLTTSWLVDSAGSDEIQNLFVGNVGFLDPVISIARVEQLDSGSDTVSRILIPDLHYSIIRASVRSQFTAADNDVLVIKGFEEERDAETGDLTGVTIPLFIGQRIRITYLTNPDIGLIQEFVDADERRNVTSNSQIYAPDVVLINIRLSYVGALTTDDVSTILKEYVNEKGFGSVVSTNEIITVLALFGVKDVVMPVQLEARRDTGSGDFVFSSSEDRITIEANQIFATDPVLSLVKVAAV